MGNLPLPASQARGVLDRETETRTPSPQPKNPSPLPPSRDSALEVLAQAVETGGQSTDAILTAVANTARVLAGAEGTALALRTGGVIRCRARSGGIAPELGSPLNTDSGISGECLRTGTTLVCNDADHDERVDPEVCRLLGIRSIAVVPVEGQGLVIGILEAFSTRTNAFQDEEISLLRELADIAAKAYERERTAPPQAAVTKPTALVVFAPATEQRSKANAAAFQEFLALNRYWVLGGIAVLLLFATIIRMSWKQTESEIAASEPAGRSASTENANRDASGSALTPILTVHPTDRASANRTPGDNSTAKELVKQAADIQPTSGGGADATNRSVTAEKTSASTVPQPTVSETSPPASEKSAPSDSNSDAPPTVELAASNAPDALIRSAGGSPVMPGFGAPVSKGAVDADLVHRVDPIYPSEARMQHVTGSVTLDTIIGKDGSIHFVKVVDGPLILANAATAAVRQWRYRPATLNGAPVETERKITVIFKLP